MNLYYQILASIHRRLAIRELRRLEKKLTPLASKVAIPFVFRGKGYFKTMECMQNYEEIERLFLKVCEIQPRKILEIGTAKGGALYLWLQAAQEDATIVSVDLPFGEFGGGYLPCRIPFYQAFTKPTQTLHLVRENSHSLSTLETTQRLFEGEKIDFLFIDGDHTYEGVKQDFEFYSPMVKEGGLIAFHDVLPRTDIPEIQVAPFWDEVRKNYESWEFIGSEGSGRKIGCGVIRYRCA